MIHDLIEQNHLSFGFGKINDSLVISGLARNDIRFHQYRFDDVEGEFTSPASIYRILKKMGINNLGKNSVKAITDDWVRLGQLLGSDIEIRPFLRAGKIGLEMKDAFLYDSDVLCQLDSTFKFNVVADDAEQEFSFEVEGKYNLKLIWNWS